MARTPRDMAESQLNYATMQVVEGFNQVADRMREYAETIERRVADICSREDSTKKSTLAEWAINDVENLIRNLCLSQMASRIARLAVAEQAIEDLND